MKIEQTTPLITKNLWGIIRAILYMVKKGLTKNIPWFELQMMLKRSTKFAEKAIENLHLDHQTLTCRPNNISTTFIAPLEYQFSCTNTPIFHPKRKNNRHLLYRRANKSNHMTVNKVKKVFDILNTYDATSESARPEQAEKASLTLLGFRTSTETEKSPLTLLGFGFSPDVRQLRVTDSPFPVNYVEEEGGRHVDKAAEEFIKNFYKELRVEKNRADVEPPSPLCYRKWSQVR